MAIQFKGNWLAHDFENDGDMDVIAEAFIKNYGIDKMNDPTKAWPTYGLWRAVGPNKGRVAIGTFAHPEELIAMLKLILASEE